jgi:uncharacterized protein (DUF488 family)
MPVQHGLTERSMASIELWTVGHSTRSFDELVSLLRAWRIEMVVDVRTVPRSRRHPQFNADALAVTLPERGIAYVPMPELGGFRRAQADSPNAAWKTASFRGYADYMLTAEFEQALDRLVEVSAASRVAVMCAEAVPWRCHRSLIGDALVARGHVVHDITSETQAREHRMTRFAHVEGGRVTYPAVAG